MNAQDELSYGDAQQAAIELRRETYPDQLNVTFTRGVVSSQAFVDKYDKFGPISKLIPADADKGLDFKPTHPKTKEALDWMGFEAREEILATLDAAIKDKAEVRVVAYELNEPEVVERLEKIGNRLKVIVDDSSNHKKPQTAESKAAARLVATAGEDNVKRQHMGQLQHNKTIVVDGPTVQKVVCGSTNFSWRGFFVQGNNAMILEGAKPVKVFRAGFEDYWNNQDSFKSTDSAKLNKIGLTGIDANVAFSPHSASNVLLKTIATDIRDNTESSLFFSLAFLYQTPGPILDAIKKVSDDDGIFVYGISDRKVGGLDIKRPEGNVTPVFPAALTKNVPAPFNEEPTGGKGVRLHHKFVVIDFDKPSARVYLGSYNFSDTADTKNGENLLIVRDRRIAVSYMIEALRIFDHYHFRVVQQEAKQARKTLQLAKPPRKPQEKPWWDEDYTDAHKIKDRELFA
jgi:phosphatidylserine/phosphatidylglycerophosphate/cardiolipin synthase-like enzyme